MSQTNDRLERARTTVETIEGWLTVAEGELLFGLAAACPPGLPVVEIGSWKGKSTVWLASGVRPSAGTLVFAIDPHEQSLEDPHAATLDDLKKNLARSGLANAVVPIVSTSHEAAKSFDQRPGVIFLDGNHKEEAVRVDLADWFPKLADGGAFVIHDVFGDLWPGPRRALRTLLWTSTQIRGVHFVDTLAWMRKVENNSATDRLLNRLAAALLVAYEMRPARLPAPIATLLRKVYRWTPLKRRARPS